MRIAGGNQRGIELAVPGRAVRPTQERVREALFSILASRIPGAAFLDLYAGSGAVGLEAWSRGASRVVWVESNRRVLRVLKENVTRCGAPGDGVVPGDVLTMLRRGIAGQPFDVVFADPPYGERVDTAAGQRLCAAVADSRVMAENGVFVLECAGETPKPAEGWTVCDNRSYGDTTLLFLQSESAGDGGRYKRDL